MSATASESSSLFETFFQAEARLFLLAGIRIALSEDGKDLTSQGIFTDQDLATAHIVAKDHAVIAGLPLIPLILEFAGCEFQHMLNVDEGDRVSPGTLVAAIQGPATHLLRTERVILKAHAPRCSTRARRCPDCAILKNTPCLWAAQKTTASTFPKCS